MKKILTIIIAIMLVTVCAFAMTGCNTKTYKIGVQGGTTGQYYVEGDKGWGFPGFGNIECKHYPNAGQAVTDMKNGSVDYVIVDEAPAKYLVKQVADVKVIDIKLTEENYAFGVNKQDATLLQQVNTFLAKIVDNGKFQEILDKYFNDGTITGITSSTFDANKNQLVVATNAGFPPFEYKIGDKFAGIDMEIAKLLADELSMELVIMDIDFDSVVTSVGKNGVDMAMAGLTINDTRKESVNFTNSYYEASQMLIVKKDDTTFDNCTTAAQVEEILKNLKK